MERMLSSAEIKRQILIDADRIGIKKKIFDKPDGKNWDDVVEMGTAFEQLVKMKGWIYIESFMIKGMDVVGLYFGQTSEDKKGYGRAFIELMQYVQQTIDAKNEILRRRENPKGTQKEKDNGK